MSNDTASETNFHTVTIALNHNRLGQNSAKKGMLKGWTCRLYLQLGPEFKLYSRILYICYIQKSNSSLTLFLGSTLNNVTPSSSGPHSKTWGPFTDPPLSVCGSFFFNCPHQHRWSLFLLNFPFRVLKTFCLLYCSAPVEARNSSAMILLDPFLPVLSLDPLSAQQS